MAIMENRQDHVPQVVVDVGDRDLDDAEQRPDDRRRRQERAYATCRQGRLHVGIVSLVRRCSVLTHHKAREWFQPRGPANKSIPSPKRATQR